MSESIELDPKHMVYLKAEAKYIQAGGTTATERELTTWVMDVAKAAGWLIYHVPDSRRAPSGFPDLVLLRPPQVLFYELKKLGRGGTLKPLQEQWLNGLQRCGLEAGVWRASEIPEIWQRLTGLPFEP